MGAHHGRGKALSHREPVGLRCSEWMSVGGPGDGTVSAPGGAAAAARRPARQRAGATSIGAADAFPQIELMRRLWTSRSTCSSGVHPEPAGIVSLVVVSAFANDRFGPLACEIHHGMVSVCVTNFDLVACSE